MSRLKKLRRKQKSGPLQTAIAGSLSSSTQASASKPYPQTAHALPQLQKSSVYSSIEEVTIMQFIECAEGKLSVLVKEGEPSELELHTAWLEIKSQHIENIGDAETLYKIEREVEKSDFAAKEAAVKALLTILSSKYDTRIIKELEAWGYSYEFSEESYKEDIDRVLAELGSESVEYNEQEPEQRDGKPIRQQYIDTIRILQRSVKMGAGMTQIEAAKRFTMYEYGLALKEHNELARTQKPQNEEEDGND